MKDIRVTDEFVGLGQGITHCQTEDFRADCVTRKLREKILQSCQCSPAYMRSYYGNLVDHKIYTSQCSVVTNSLVVGRRFGGM